MSSSSIRPGLHPGASGGRVTPGGSSLASSRSRPTRMVLQSPASVPSNAHRNGIGQYAAGQRQRVAPGSTLEPTLLNGQPPMIGYAPKPWQRGYRAHRDLPMAAVLRPSCGSFSARSARSDYSSECEWRGGRGGSDERSLSTEPQQRSRCGSQSMERQRHVGVRVGSVQRSSSAGPEQHMRCSSQSRRSSETEQSSVWDGSTIPSATTWENRDDHTFARLREHLARNGVGRRRSDDFSEVM